MKIYIATKIALLALMVHILAGCGLQVGPVKLPDGFAFSVGVNNVDQVLDRKGLNVDKRAY